MEGSFLWRRRKSRSERTRHRKVIARDRKKSWTSKGDENWIGGEVKMLKAGERKEGNARLQRRKKGKYNTDGGRMKTNELKTVKVSRSISFAVFWLHHSGFLYKLVHYNPATPTSPKSTCFWQLLNNSLGKARKPQIEAELESFPLRKIWEVPTLGGKGKWAEVNLHSVFKKI